MPDAAQVADPFHVVRLGNDALDEVRRRVQNQTLGHRGHKHDPLYRARKLLVSASENVTDSGRIRLRGLLDAGDPYGEVRDAWHAKETLRSVYDINDADIGAATVAQLASDLQDPAMPTEINRLGRTIWRWRTQIANWHTARVTNAATEAANNLIKRVKRAAFGFTNFANYRIRALLYAGKPDWALLDTLTPPSNAKSHQSAPRLERAIGVSDRHPDLGGPLHSLERVVVSRHIREPLALSSRGGRNSQDRPDHSQHDQTHPRPIEQPAAQISRVSATPPPARNAGLVVAASLVTATETTSLSP